MFVESRQNLINPKVAAEAENNILLKNELAYHYPD